MSHVVGGVDISSFLKARDKFEEYRIDMMTERDRAGAIQAFEFTYELAWKTIRRILKMQGIPSPDISSPKSWIREAAKIGLVSNPKMWFEFITIRNLTIHTYNELMPEKIIKCFDDFSTSLDELVLNLEKIK